MAWSKSFPGVHSWSLGNWKNRSLVTIRSAFWRGLSQWDQYKRQEEMRVGDLEKAVSVFANVELEQLIFPPLMAYDSWKYIHKQFSSVQSLSHVQLFATPWTAACQASLSITNSQSLLKLMSIESVIPSNHLILCHPLLLPPSVFPNIRVFSNESVFHIRWPKYWSFNFSTSSSSVYSELISFRIDWLDLLSVSPRDYQESSPTPQFKSVNSSVLSFLYSPTLTSIHDYWKNHSLD